jgi:hypothetical protein
LSAIESSFNEKQFAHTFGLVSDRLTILIIAILSDRMEPLELFFDNQIYLSAIESSLNEKQFAHTFGLVSDRLTILKIAI